jgi:hypothetical protein
MRQRTLPDHQGNADDQYAATSSSQDQGKSKLRSRNVGWQLLLAT